MHVVPHREPLPGPPQPRAPPKELTMFVAGLAPSTHERVSMGQAVYMADFTEGGLELLLSLSLCCT